MKFSTEVFLGAMDNLNLPRYGFQTLQLHILRTKEHFLILFMKHKVKVTYKYFKKKLPCSGIWGYFVPNWAQIHVHAFILKLSLQVFLNPIRSWGILGSDISQCPPHPFYWQEGGRGGVEPPTKFSKMGAWKNLNFERKVAGKEGQTFFRAGCNFSERKKKEKKEN